MRSLHDEQPNARYAGPAAPPIREPLSVQDLMTLDSIQRAFATTGKTYWAGVVQRAIKALEPTYRPAVQTTDPNAAEPVIIPIKLPESMPVGQQPGRYIGLQNAEPVLPPCDTEPA